MLLATFCSEGSKGKRADIPFFVFLSLAHDVASSRVHGDSDEWRRRNSFEGIPAEGRMISHQIRNVDQSDPYHWVRVQRTFALGRQMLFPYSVDTIVPLETMQYARSKT